MVNVRHDITEPTVKRPHFYFWIALAMTATTLFGFFFTYFGPMLSGTYPVVSPAVHLHGWSFFAWYLLLPIQAGLVAARRVAVHRTLGTASTVLAALMVATGLVVLSTQMKLALAPGGSPFWFAMGPGILSTMLLFAGFYVAAYRTRRQPSAHRRYIVLASAGGMGAATFRVFGVLFGFADWVNMASILAPNVFVVAAMLHDVRQEKRVHPIYVWGLAISVALEGAMLVLGMTAAGDPLRQGLAWVGQLVAPVY